MSFRAHYHKWLLFLKDLYFLLKANRDKESMVIKYAMGEKDILIARKGKEVAEKKLADSLKDKEGLQYKIKTLSNERTRLQVNWARNKGDFSWCRQNPSKWFFFR